MTVLSNKTVSRKLAKSSKIKGICIFWVLFRKKFKITKLIENLTICILYMSVVILYTYLTLYYFTEQETEEKEKSKEASDKC